MKEVVIEELQEERSRGQHTRHQIQVKSGLDGSQNRSYPAPADDTEPPPSAKETPTPRSILPRVAPVFDGLAAMDPPSPPVAPKISPEFLSAEDRSLMFFMRRTFSMSTGLGNEQ